MATERTRKRAKSGVPTRLEAHFVKSNSYRVVHADGVWGGLTPQGQIRMAIFSEAYQLPQTVTYDIGSGSMQEAGRIPPLASTALERELQVDVVLGLSVAQAVHSWLGDKIRQLEQAIAESHSSNQRVRGDADANAGS